MRFPGATLLTPLLVLLSSCATAPTRPPEREVPYGEPPPLVIVHKPADRPPAPPPPLAPTEPPPVLAPPAAGKGGDAMIVHLLDVGQGAATLVEFPCGAVLIDTGGEQNEEFHSNEALRAQLDAFFKRRADLKKTIDVLFLTHPHIDHVRGVPDVLAHYTVKNVVDNGLLGENNVREPMSVLRDFTSAHGDHYRAAHRDAIDAKTGLTDAVVDPVRCAPVDPLIRVLSGSVDGDPGWGDDKYGKRNADNMNNHSVVVRIDYGKSSFLVTGDLEEPAIDDLVDKYRSSKLLDADVVQAGHHGSYNGTTSGLVGAETPKVALIAMGPEWRHHSWTAWAYGHPREQAVRLLEDAVSLSRQSAEVNIGVKVKGFVVERLDRAVYGTGWDGAVDVTMAADGTIAVATHPTHAAAE